MIIAPQRILRIRASFIVGRISGGSSGDPATSCSGQTFPRGVKHRRSMNELPHDIRFDTDNVLNMVSSRNGMVKLASCMLLKEPRASALSYSTPISGSNRTSGYATQQSKDDSRSVAPPEPPYDRSHTRHARREVIFKIIGENTKNSIIYVSTGAGRIYPPPSC